MATQLAERRDDPVAVVRQNLTQMSDQLKMALPSHVPVDKFHRVTMTAVQGNPLLLDADRRSLFGAIVKAAQDGLLPDGREGALVIFNKQVQWMPMVAGILKKVRQSGELASIDAQIVHANDKFTYRPGIDSVPIHEPDWFGDRGEPVGVYAVARLKDGNVIPPEIMNRAQIEQVRKVSRASGNGPWVSWWGEMARKTVIRRLSKRLPMSTDIEAAFDRDETMQADAAALVMAAPQAAPQIAAPPAPSSRLDALEARLGIGDDASDAGQAAAMTTLPSALADEVLSDIAGAGDIEELEMSQRFHAESIAALATTDPSMHERLTKAFEDRRGALLASQSGAWRHNPMNAG
jgi:recombination protein RecT